jgi:hypothetical protein
VSHPDCLKFLGPNCVNLPAFPSQQGLCELGRSNLTLRGLHRSLSQASVARRRKKANKRTVVLTKAAASGDGRSGYIRGRKIRFRWNE